MISDCGEQRDPVLVVGLAFGLAHVVAEGGAGDAFEESDHGEAEEAEWVRHPEDFAVGALREDAEVDGRDVLVARVDGGGAVDVEFQEGELREDLGAHGFFDLLFGPARFFFDV